MIAVIIYYFGMRRRPDKNEAASSLSTELD